MSSRYAQWGGALRDDPYNGCKGDYRITRTANQISEPSAFRENMGLVGCQFSRALKPCSNPCYLRSMDFPRNFIPIQKCAWALGTRLGYKRKDQPITNPCSVKGKLRKNAVCYKKSALNNCALCIIRSQ